MPRSKRENNTRRLTLEMNEVTNAKLEALRQQTGSESYVEVIRKALAVYEFVHAEKERGRKVITTDPDGGDAREIVLM